MAHLAISASETPQPPASVAIRIPEKQMFLQEPAQSPYDLRFQFLGFPVRISWTFWAMCIVLGYGFAQGLDAQFGLASPGIPVLLLIWAACLLVSILIHELGHALAFRQNRIESSIVLYFLGGLAIPSSNNSSWRGESRMTPGQSMWVSAAGPIAQFGSALLLIAIFRFAGYRVPVPPPLSYFSIFDEGNQIDSVGLLSMLAMYIYPSVLWALLNLLPVWPLDGGRIVGSFLQMQGGNMVQALWVGVITAALVAGYGFSTGENYLAVMFAILGVNNYQAIQQISGPRY